VNPIAWYLDTIASWGLLPTPYITEYTISGGIVVGGILGIICMGLAIAGMVAFFCDGDFSYRFDDSLLMLVGYRMTATIASVLGVIVAGGLGLCLGATVFGLFALTPWLSLGVIVVLGPLLMLIGSVKRRGLRLNLRRKQKVAARVVNYDEPAQSFELGEDFHTIDYEGEKIIMPN
jgi:hypothetical protein